MRGLFLTAAFTLALTGAAMANGFPGRGEAVPHDPAAELRRMTGSEFYPAPRGGAVSVPAGHPMQMTSSERHPQIHAKGAPHAGMDMLITDSSRYPVLNQDTMRHPPPSWPRAWR